MNIIKLFKAFTEKEREQGTPLGELIVLIGTLLLLFTLVMGFYMLGIYMLLVILLIAISYIVYKFYNYIKEENDNND